MYPAWNMHLSTLHTEHPTNQLHQPVILHTCLPDQCATAYPSVVTVIQWTLHIVPVKQPQNPLTIEDKDFQTVPLDDEHWSTEMIPERTFCRHENGLSNNVCSYPCPYDHNGSTSYKDSLDLSDISDLEDHFLTTSNDEELPGLEEVPY